MGRKTFIMPQPHVEMCNFGDEAVRDCTFKGDEQQLYMVGVPRDCGKTTIFSCDLPIMVLEKNPNARILLDAHRHDASKRRLRAISREIDRRWPEWKPEFREDIWNDDSIVITRRTEVYQDPSIGTAGVDRSMTGGHFDLIVADDLVLDTNIRTAEMRERVYDHIKDLLPILAPGGTLILVFTRWHVDDAYGRFIREDEELERAGYAPDWKKLIRGAYLEDGSLYFPARLTGEFLERAKRRLGSKKFASQYLNQPVSEEDKTFNMDLARIQTFKYFTTSDGYAVVDAPNLGGQYPVETTIAWDPAGRKPTRTSDSHGITIVGDDPTDRWWLLEAEGIKGRPTDIINRMCNLILFYKPRTVSCEDVLGQGLWLDLLRMELDLRGIPVPGFHEYSPKGVSKNARIELLQPRWERGGLIIRPTQTAFMRQADQFSPGVEQDHEDILDSLVQHIEVARPASAMGPVIDNPFDEQWFARKARIEKETRVSSRAGRSGSVWDVAL